MKNLIKVILLAALLTPNISCRHNRLKVNEKELRNVIVTEEKEASEKAANEKKLADSLKGRQPTLRFREKRSVDPSHLPLIIDIEGSLNNVKEIKLSDVAGGVSYVPMESVPDSTIPSDLKYSYQLMDNYIVAVNLYGIHLFTRDGKYLRSVVKNHFSGVKVMSGSVMFWNDYTMIGGGTSVWSEGNDLFYNYSNNITGQKYIMKYDCSAFQVKPEYKFDPEKPDQIAGAGEIAIDLNHGKTETPKPRRHQGMFGGPVEFLFLQRDPFMLDHNSYSLPSYNDYMMVVLDKNGDTLSSFSMLEKLKNYTKELQRGTDGGSLYVSNGRQFFRPEFNDTDFEVIAPNRLLPVYVLNLGSYKVSKQLGVDPDFKLTGKIIPGEWAETKDLVFMTFTKDDYDCQNTRKKKSVKIYHALFSKQNKQLSVIKGDPYDYDPDILLNDLDGGVNVWPASYMIGDAGEILISLKGKDLKDRVKSEQFKGSKAAEVKKKSLEKLAAAVSNNEDILMIIK